MTRTLDNFCDKLMRDVSPARRLEPERLAAYFPRYFGLSGRYRPTLDELAEVFERAGIGKPGQGGRKEQPGIGHQAAVVEGDLDPVGVVA